MSQGHPGRGSLRLHGTLPLLGALTHLVAGGLGSWILAWGEPWAAALAYSLVVWILAGPIAWVGTPKALLAFGGFLLGRPRKNLIRFIQASHHPKSIHFSSLVLLVIRVMVVTFYLKQSPGAFAWTVTCVGGLSGVGILLTHVLGEPRRSKRSLGEGQPRPVLALWICLGLCFCLPTLGPAPALAALGVTWLVALIVAKVSDIALGGLGVEGLGLCSDTIVVSVLALLAFSQT